MGILFLGLDLKERYTFDEGLDTANLPVIE